MDSVRLILVEDEPTQRFMLARQLTRAGYVVDTAEDGEEALPKVLGGSYQIMVTDWDMPRMDGVTLCRRVRAANLSAYVYIVFLSGHLTTDDVVEGLGTGADAYIKKPANQAELLARLATGSRIAKLEHSFRQSKKEIELLARTDPELGIFNRGYLNTELEKEVERAQRQHRPLTIIMSDMDRLKAVNDRFGHHVGGEVLRSFASMTTRCVGEIGWVALYGGEELVIVVPNTDLAECERIAEAIRLESSTTPAMTSAGEITVTASFGVAKLRAVDEVPAVAAGILVRDADEACYESKREGRNRVTIFREEISS